MKIRIILANSAGELDNRVIDVNDDDSVEVSAAIFEAMEDWILSPGDVISIQETRE